MSDEAAKYRTTASDLRPFSTATAHQPPALAVAALMLLLLSWKGVPVPSGLAYLAYLVFVIWLPGRTSLVLGAESSQGARPDCCARPCWRLGLAVPHSVMQSNSSPIRWRGGQAIRGST